MHGQGADVRVSQVHIENALKKSIAASVRKSNVFADKMAKARGKDKNSNYDSDIQSKKSEIEMEPEFVDEKQVSLMND